MESELPGIIRVKVVAKKYTAWVPGDLTPSCFCNVISLFEETYKFSESNCYTSVFSLLISTRLWFM